MEKDKDKSVTTQEPETHVFAGPEPEAIVRRPPAFTLAPTSLEEALEFSKLIAASELCPNEYRGKPQAVLIAVQMGAELGIPPMQALQNIAVINGRPTMWGDLVIGLVQASGLLEWIDEREPQAALEKHEGRCEVKRVGVADPVVRTFTHEMAEKAGLIARARGAKGEGPWITYEGRMLQMRARAWALRDTFSDVLKGLIPREEVEDYPPLPEPIKMPRRRSEAAGKKIEDFVRETTARPSSPPSLADRSPIVEPSTGERWVGQVASVAERQGKGWTVYTIRGRDGHEFTTFEPPFAQFARDAGSSPVWIRWEMTTGKKDPSKVYHRIIGIGPELTKEAQDYDREPGEDG